MRTSNIVDLKTKKTPKTGSELPAEPKELVAPHCRVAVWDENYVDDDHHLTPVAPITEDPSNDMVGRRCRSSLVDVLQVDVLLTPR